MQNLVFSKRLNSISFLLLFVFSQGSAQTNTVKGAINGMNGNPLQYVNVLLLNSSDSSLIKGVISDSLGNYQFKNIDKGKYLISATMTGFKQSFTKEFEIISNVGEFDLGILNLMNTDLQLKEVTVAAKKPMFEQKQDRTVINVRNSISSAGGTALEVLEKSPGVSVNRQDNSIAINGKSGVAVMINGKISYMPADALIQFLSGVSAGNIEKIELITTPPSKYDAGGNGGYINIVLINNPYAGLNGSYFLTAGYGDRPLGAAGLNFNYRSAKINFYGNYSFNYNHTIQTSTAFTQFTRDGDIITNNSFSDRDAITQVHNLRMGVDFQLDTATIVGVLLSGYNSRWSMVARNGATISKNNVMDTTIIMVDDPEINHWQNITTNLNFQHSFKPGGVLYFDVNYIYYKDNNPNTYYTDYFNEASKFLYHEVLRGGKLTPIHFQVYSSDYKTQVGKIGVLEAGAKMTLSDFTNEVSVDSLFQGIWVPNTMLTATYFLKENIAAAYSSINFRPNDKISISAGLRYEYTTSNLRTIDSANIVNRKYGELFPTFTLSKKIDGKSSFNISYSRRITRPTFNDLAPFTIFFDPKTFYSGNPALQPAIANAIQAGYNFKNYSFTISFTHETNTIDNFYFQTQRLDTVNNIVYLSARNFKSEQYLTAGFSLPVVVSPWWSMQNNITLDWRQINTAYEKIPVQLQNISYRLNSIQRFTLPEDFAIEVSGFYSSASYLGTAKRKPYYQLDAGLQKKIGRNKDILRFTANDVFNSGGNWRFVEKLPVASATVGRDFNFRLVAYKLTYTHNFGNRALKEKRERSTGAEDELKRVQN